MNKEDKELLLKDISGRLPYGQIVKISLFRNDGRKGDIELDPHVTENIWEMIDKYHALPYLRPMSSMTEEEKVQLSQYACIGEDLNGEFIDEVQRKDCAEYIDWLNKNHFDYRGLIEKGLAIEAPEGMYNIN